MHTHRVLAVATVLVLSLLVVPVAPAAAQSDSCTVDVDGMGTAVDAYNQNRGELPGPLRSQLAGERVNVVVTSSGADTEYSAVTNADAMVTSFSEGLVDDPTLRIETSESTVCEILDSETPVAATLDAYRSGDIDVTGVGAVKSVTLGVVKAAFDIGDALGLF